MGNVSVEDVRKAIAILKPGGELFEVRVVYEKNMICSGYFTDVDVMLAALGRLDQKDCNVYLSLGAINSACYSRKQRDCFLRGVKTTSDTDVDGYTWLMIDLDPVRPSGTSSSNAEIEAVKGKVTAIRRFLRERGFNDPVIGFSGNGYHLLYRVNLENNEDNRALVKRFLETLDVLFSDESVKVDKQNFNPARTCKLYGTLAQKGLSTEERPHRFSKIITDGSSEPTTKAYLESFCAIVSNEPDTPQKYNRFSPREFDLEDWMAKYGIRWRSVEQYGSSTKYVLEHCPFDENHKNKDAVIFKASNGAISFVCLHNSCADKKWRDVRMKYEPGAYEKRWEEEDRRVYKTHKRNEPLPPIEEKDSQPVFWTLNEIIKKPRPAETYIKTGIKEFDSKHRGLKKRGVMILSGYTGGGKSTLLSQIILNALNDGNKVACFSGEFAEDDFASWIILQAAGRMNVEPGKYDGYYNVPKNTQKKIASWVGRNLLAYNNFYGFNYNRIRDACIKQIEENKIDLLCLDNLMAFDIADLSENELKAQTAFIWDLHSIAMQHNIHILLVAHPKKTSGLLGWQDISGSSNIVNAIDTLMYAYRVDQAFRNYFIDFYKHDCTEDIEDATNAICVKKARFGNVDDKYIPLWFEKETKRLKNSKAETIHYGWEHSEDNDGFVPADDNSNPFL